jgi:hypothetical protein
VVVAAPGDSFSEFYPSEASRSDAIVAVNLAVTRITAADYWFVIDDPSEQGIRDTKRRQQFLGCRTKAKLICPTTSKSWARELWEFTETRPFQHEYLPVGTTKAGSKAPPLIPCFGSAAYGAVAAAFAMGAAEVRMVGIDHGPAMNQNKAIVERLINAYRILTRWTRQHGRVLTQCNPRSLIQPSTY